MPKELKALAERLGAFYETGAWRFPSVWAKDEFQRQAAARGYLVE